MTVVTRIVEAPTTADAAVAAEALVAAGAEEVLLFGSVAHGDADETSDIDLLAIFADIDYTMRWDLIRRLEETAREAVDRWPVQVMVTDRPEWRNRVEKVSTSFECVISVEAVRVAESSTRGPVRWDKEMVLPMSNPSEALKQFTDRVLDQLAGLERASTLSRREDDLSAPGWWRETARLRRMVQVCTHSAMAVELALKSLSVLHRIQTPSENVLRAAAHSISACLQLLPEPVRGLVETLVTGRGLRPRDLPQWRVISTYPGDTAQVQELADQTVDDYTGTALDVCGFVIDNLRTAVGDTPGMRAAEYEWEQAAAYLGAMDIRTGQPKVEPQVPG